MSRGTTNQSYFVLGHKTDNIRDLYTHGRKLGQGRFGTTYLCTEISTGIEYACKSISKRKLISKEDVEDVRREIQIMHHLAGHKNIVTIKGAYEDSLYVHIVMELCVGGDLFYLIKQRGHFGERKAAELTKIIVGVVEACHSLGVMHRDLKPENFLLVNKDDDFSLKAIDFGLSVFFMPGQIFTDVVGGCYYVAPEVLTKHYGQEADVWAAGVILYILLSGGVPPFRAETQQGIFDVEGHIDFDSDPWPLISESAKDLIRKMLCMRPSKRLTTQEVLCHPWICENGVAPDSLDPAVLSRLRQFSAMNRLKKMALRVIAESLSEEKIAGLREMFKAMDTDNSGAITFDELKTGLRKYGSILKDTEIRDLMDAADVDNSGTIDYGEFIAATVHLNKLEREEHLWAAFLYFDKDASGYITFDELQHACVEHGVTDVFLEDIIKEVDQDNDGRIDYGDFVAMMTKGNAGDSSSSTMPIPSISSNGKFRPVIKGWWKGETLGCGSFGTVYEGITDNGFFFAVKEVSLLDEGDHGKQCIIQLEQEIALLSQFEHENILQYYCTKKDESHLYIFLELVTKGSLRSLYQKYELRPPQVSAYTRQILKGLKYLHDRNVVHRDIKCANILVHTYAVVKLADFGLAKVTKLNDVKSCKGTWRWMAPEVVRNKGYGLPADIWSLGCTVLEMLTGCHPYPDCEEAAAALFRIGRGERPPIPDSLPNDARDFILECLQVDPSLRPTANQLLDHPFVKRPLQSYSGTSSQLLQADLS